MLRKRDNQGDLSCLLLAQRRQFALQLTRLQNPACKDQYTQEWAKSAPFSQVSPLFLKLLAAQRLSEAEAILSNTPLLWRVANTRLFSLSLARLYCAYTHSLQWQHSYRLCVCTLQGCSSAFLDPFTLAVMCNRQLSNTDRDLPQFLTLLQEVVNWETHLQQSSTICALTTHAITVPSLTSRILPAINDRLGDHCTSPVHLTEIEVYWLETVTKATHLSEELRGISHRVLALWSTAQGSCQKAVEHWLEFASASEHLSPLDSSLIRDSLRTYMASHSLSTLPPAAISALHKEFLRTGDFSEVVMFYYQCRLDGKNQADIVLSELCDTYKSAVLHSSVEVAEKVAWAVLPLLLRQKAKKAVEVVTALVLRFHSDSDINKATETYERALSLANLHQAGAEVTKNLRDAFIDFCITVNTWDKAEAVANDSENALDLRGRLFTRTWQTAKAEAALTALVAEERQKTTAECTHYKELIEFYTATWNYEKAIGLMLEQLKMGKFTHKQAVAQFSKEVAQYCIAKYEYDTAEVVLAAVSSSCEMADFYTVTWQYSKAESVLQSAIQQLRQEPHSTLPLVRTLQQLAAVYHQTHRYEQAKGCLLSAVEVSLASDFRSDAAALAVQKFRNYCEGRRETTEQEAVLLRLVRLHRSTAPMADATVQALTNLSEFYRKMQRFPQAEHYLLEVLAIRRQGGAESANKALLQLADLYTSAKRPTREEAVRREVLQLYADQPTVSQQWLDAANQLADFYSRFDVKRYQAAEAVLVGIVERCRREQELGSNTFAQMRRLYDFYVKTRQYTKGETLLLETLALRQQQKPDSEQTIAANLKLAELYSSQYVNLFDKAEAALLQAWGLHRDPCSEAAKPVFEKVVELYTKRGKYQEAEEFVKKALSLWKTKRPVTAAAVSVSRTLENLYKWQRKDAGFESAVADTLAMCEADNPLSDLTISALQATADYYKGRDSAGNDKAEAALQRILHIHRGRNALSDATVAAYANLHQFYMRPNVQKPQQAEEALIAIANTQRQKDSRSDATVDALKSLASFYINAKSQPAKAEQALREVVDILERRDASSESYRNAVSALSGFYASVFGWKPGGAESTLVQAVEKTRRLFPFTEAHSAAVVRLADYYRAARKREQCESLLLDTASCLRVCAPASLGLVAILQKLVELYTSKEQFQKVEPLLLEILSVHRLRNPHSEAVFQALNKLADFSADRKEFEVAELRNIEILTRRIEQDPYAQATIAARGKLVDFYVATGEFAKAEELLLQWLLRYQRRKYEYQSALAVYQKLSELYQKQGLMLHSARYSLAYLNVIEDYKLAVRVWKELLGVHRTKLEFKECETLLVRINRVEKRPGELRTLYSE